MAIRILQGDCREVMRKLPEASVDAIVTDPPYELGFMGKAWDASGVAFDPATWREALRVLKPGGHLLAFSGTRTYHRMVCAIEDAGFEIRDQIGWVFGSGFPKSLDVSKAIDKARDDSAAVLHVTTAMADAAERAGITRADVDAAMGTSDMGGWWLSRLQHRCQCPRWEQWLQLKVLLSLSDDMDAEVWRLNGRKGMPGNERADREVSAPSNNEVFQPMQRVINPGTPVLDAARKWQGWGTALKPAWEPIVLARKPLAGTVAANVLQHGTGALNIDACRIAGEAMPPNTGAGGLPRRRDDEQRGPGIVSQPHDLGRWPANLIHDGSDEVLAAFPDAPGQIADQSSSRKNQAVYGAMRRGNGRDGEASADRENAGVVGFKMKPGGRRLDSGSAARFFYCAKADKTDRNDGGVRNTHPTVKPTDLMRYRCRLVTPPGGTVLDPFMGSGSTLKAAELEGFGAIGIELDAEYIAIARCRIAADAPLFAEVQEA